MRVWIAAPIASDDIGIAAGASVNYIDHRLIREYFSRWDTATRKMAFKSLGLGEARPECLRAVRVT